MSPTRTLAGGRALESTWQDGALPPLSALDRLALTVGVHLILWGQRHAERTDRTEQARRSGATYQAERSRTDALERRVHAGPT